MSSSILKGFDLVLDFATLGEYRVITDSAPRTVRAEDVWAVDVEWKMPERSRPACSLPRARDRKLARDRIAG